MSAVDRRRVPPLAVDVLIVVVAAAAGVAREVAFPSAGSRHLPAPVWFYAAVQVGAAATLLLRRRRPYPMALVIAGVSLLVPASAVFLAPYAVIVYGRDRRRSWMVIATLAVCWLLGARLWTVDDPFSGPGVLAISALLGLYVSARRRLVAELIDRAERAEQERLLLAEQARSDERLRIAGEMHDVVTHRINLMVLHAGALGTSTTDPAVRSAAEELRTTGCQALAELRDLVGVLRHGDPPTTRVAAQDPAAEGDLHDLVTDSRAVGLPVRLDEEGDPSALAPAMRRTLFRVVQESLTNVHKHAPGSQVTVSIRYQPDLVHATVTNGRPERAPDPDLAAAGGGSGLAGLRSRVDVLGGTLAASATPEGGFAVRATLPGYVPTAVPR
ncbi:histidine kinase [Micromonospora sp. NPDC048835]|uniref:sensor histidine kinase n=1 Tax=Micromonospora sp. NPDC048835 TaxID=3155147 RepID=UPI0033E3FEA0